MSLGLFKNKPADPRLLSLALQGGGAHGAFRYRRLLVHAITADGPLADLALSTKFNTEWSSLLGLKERGRKAAETWLTGCGTCIGVKSSIDLKTGFP